MKTTLKQFGIIFLELGFAFGIVAFFFLNEKVADYVSFINYSMEVSDGVSQLSFIPNAISAFILIFMFLIFSVGSAFSLLFIFKLTKKYRKISMPVITLLCVNLLPVLFICLNKFFMIALGVVIAIKIAVVFIFLYSMKKSGILPESKKPKSVSDIAV